MLRPTVDDSTNAQSKPFQDTESGRIVPVAGGLGGLLVSNPTASVATADCLAELASVLPSPAAASQGIGQGVDIAKCPLRCRMRHMEEAFGFSLPFAA